MTQSREPAFTIGEVALLVTAGLLGDPGDEVTVLSQLELLPVLDLENGVVSHEVFYSCQNAFGAAALCRPRELRKRRPPQDWARLCNLTDVPREAEHV